MKASELRIGNWFKTNQEVFNPREQVASKIEAAGHINDYHESFCEPIPLTEEWLLKFGFEDHKESVFTNINNPYWVHKGVCLFYVEQLYPIEIEIYLGGYGLTEIIDGKYHAATFEWNIKFVHQLQNLYFALTGEELELKMA